MQKQYVFRSMMIIGILATIILPLTFSSAKTDYASVPLKPYTSTNGNFMMGLPDGWLTVETQYHGTGAMVKSESPKDSIIIVANCSFAADMGVEMNRFLQGGGPMQDPPLKAPHDMEVKAMRRGHMQFEEEGTQQTQINGLDGYISKVTYVNARGFIGRKMTAVVVTTWNAQAPINFTLICPTKIFDQAYPLFQKVMSTYSSTVPEQKE